MAKFEVWGNVTFTLHACFDTDNEIDDQVIDALGSEALWLNFREWAITSRIHKPSKENSRPPANVLIEIVDCYGEEA